MQWHTYSISWEIETRKGQTACEHACLHWFDRLQLNEKNISIAYQTFVFEYLRLILRARLSMGQTDARCEPLSRYRLGGP